MRLESSKGFSKFRTPNWPARIHSFEQEDNLPVWYHWYELHRTHSRQVPNQECHTRFSTRAWDSLHIALTRPYSRAGERQVHPRLWGINKNILIVLLFADRKMLDIYFKNPMKKLDRQTSKRNMNQILLLAHPYLQSDRMIKLFFTNKELNRLHKRFGSSS